MPCGNLDHEHPPWPQQGAQEFVIEACENHCGWCKYQTKTANNLRIHARRHLTNENETRLRRIKIVKGKAGRKKVQMAKRRFPGAEACDEHPGRSPSVEILDNGINPGQPAIDLEENRRMEHPCEAFHPPLPAFTTHVQIPPRLNHYQDESISLNDPSRTRNERLQLPLPIASMNVLSPSKTDRIQPHGRRIPNERGTGNAESSGLSLRAINCIEQFILRPLANSKYELPDYWDKIVDGSGVICLRDLQIDLLRVPDSWKTIAKKLEFSLLVIRCIKNTVPFLKYHELVRPNDQPYNEKYFTEEEASLKARYQLPEVAKDKESGFDREMRQEQREELSYSNGTLHGADTRVGDIPMIPDHRLGERRGSQERDTNESLSNIVEGRSWTSSNLRSNQEAAYLPGDSTQNGTSQHPNPSLRGPARSCFKELGHTETELDWFSAFFGADFFSVIDRQLLLNPFPAFSQAQNDRSEFQIAIVQGIQARASKLSINALKIVHKQVLLPLLRRPSLQECKPLVLDCVGRIYMSDLGTLRDIEDLLISCARTRAISDISFLRFCNYLLRCIKILIEAGSLSDEERTHQYQSTYSETYFTELSHCIHKEADGKRALSELPAGKTWSCPASGCFFNPGSTSKPYLMVHLQEYHNEDVGCTGEEELAGLSLDPLDWRCLNCLFQNSVPASGYVCIACRVPCEEFRIKARAKLGSRENGIGTIQQDSPSTNASAIASSQSIEQGETSSLDTLMEHRSETLQPHLSLPESVTSPRVASNAALELPASTTATQPTISEKRHQDGIVGANQSSGSIVLEHPLFCVGCYCRFHFSTRFNTLTEFRLHLEKNHKASVKFLAGKLIYECQAVGGSLFRQDACCRTEFATMPDLLKHQEDNHGLHSR